MRLSTKRVLSILTALFFFIAALLVYFNLVKTEGDAVNDLRAELLSKSALLDAQQHVIDQVQNLIARFQNIGAVQISVSLAIPEGEKNVDAIRQIEAIARLSGITLSSLDFKSGAAKPAVRRAQASEASAQSLIKKIGVLKVNLSATGPYVGLKLFLSQLETTVRIANVKSFQFTPGGGQETNDRLAVELEMYYQE